MSIADVVTAEFQQYPPNWPRISYDVRGRAGWRCECLGECGRVNDHLLPVDGRCRNRQGMPAYGSRALVILQAAHRNHVPADCRPENLAAYCPGCHLAHDRPHREATKPERVAAALGMDPLFPLPALTGAR